MYLLHGDKLVNNLFIVNLCKFNSFHKIKLRCFIRLLTTKYYVFFEQKCKHKYEK